LELRLAFDRERRICGFWIDAEDKTKLNGFPKDGYRYGTVVEAAAAADLSLEARVFGLNGQPVEKCSIGFWMATDDENDEEVAKRWHDTVTHKIWRYVGGASTGNSMTERFLSPGLYRIVAIEGHGFGPPVGLSDPIRLDGSQKHTIVDVKMTAGSTLKFQPLDAVTKKLVPRPGILLVCKSGNLPPDWHFSPSMSDAEAKIDNLPPGDYSISAELRANSPNDLEYRLADSPLDITIGSSENREVTLPMNAARLTEEEIAKRWPWAISGRVTDGSGQPVEGATVRAHNGLATLFETGSTRTAKDGRYTLRWAAGGVVSSKQKDGTIVHSYGTSVISAGKPGYAERSRSGSGQFYGGAANGSLDFVLVTAPSVDVELVDGENKPIAKRGLCLTGDHLPPACSVLRGGGTDSQGQAEFEDIPPDFPWEFFVEAESRREIRTPSMTFATPDNYRVQLRLRHDASFNLDLLEVMSIKNSKGEEVREQVVADEPLAYAPLSPDLQTKGREILAKVADANRYWLGRPPSEVNSYRYDFKYSHGESKTYKVMEDGIVPADFRPGMSAPSMLVDMTMHPDDVVFRKISVQSDEIQLAFTFRHIVPGHGDNVVTANGSGCFNHGVWEGTIVVDPKTFVPRRCLSGSYTEVFLDYTEIRPGYVVPLRIEMTYNGSKYALKFHIYEPGLWLLAASYLESSIMAQVDNVIVNGEPAISASPR
jgi:hypothetical protein